MVGVLMTQWLMDSPSAPPVFVDFWRSTYEAARVRGAPRAAPAGSESRARSGRERGEGASGGHARRASRSPTPRWRSPRARWTLPPPAPSPLRGIAADLPAPTRSRRACRGRSPRCLPFGCGHSGLEGGVEPVRRAAQGAARRGRLFMGHLVVDQNDELHPCPLGDGQALNGQGSARLNDRLDTVRSHGFLACFPFHRPR
ncbi:uncharacterized protein SOCEGT47_059630 [Sorangium cellulosum]|uniref:Uncharacterized protein n=1 Tax=Sorangium cellulosum TaxID=56 RepID=A0A4P2Q7C9_SORCE|nr:uncharacterized protein SOCEGT47_059630 [Sorangium cellulosum]